MIPSDRYVAISEFYLNSSTLIGTPPYPISWPPFNPGLLVGFDPNNSHGDLSFQLQHFGVTVNNSLKILFYNLRWDDKPTSRGGVGESMYGIYSLPYTTEDGFTITNITSNGTLMAIYKNRSVILLPGDNRTFNVSDINTTGTYNAFTANKSNNPEDPYNYAPMTWQVHNVQNFTLTNEGMFNTSVLIKAEAKN
jgi:hypothetical protein